MNRYLKIWYFNDTINNIYYQTL